MNEVSVLNAGEVLQVSHDDKGATGVTFLEAVDVSQPARVQQVITSEPC